MEKKKEMLKILKLNLKKKNFFSQINSSSLFITRNFSDNSSNSNINSNFSSEISNLSNSSSSSSIPSIPIPSDSTLSIPTVPITTPPSPSTTSSSSFIPDEIHPFNLLGQLIDNVHTTFDIPYWQTIILCTIAARALLFPVTILQEHQQQEEEEEGTNNNNNNTTI